MGRILLRYVDLSSLACDPNRATPCCNVPSCGMQRAPLSLSIRFVPSLPIRLAMGSECNNPILLSQRRSFHLRFSPKLYSPLASFVL